MIKDTRRVTTGITVTQKSELIADEMVPALASCVLIGGIYKHRNGNLYKVLHVACNTEDLSWHVIYEALYKNDVSQIWSRKLDDFLAIITLENGAQQPRFMYQGEMV